MDGRLVVLTVGLGVVGWLALCCGGILWWAHHQNTVRARWLARQAISRARA